MIGQATKNTSTKKKPEQQKANSFMKKNYQYIFICCQRLNPDAGQSVEKRELKCVIAKGKRR